MATINDTNERNISTVRTTPYGVRSGSSSQMERQTSKVQKKASSTIREGLGTQAVGTEELSASAIDNLNAVTAMMLNPYSPERQEKRQTALREDRQQEAAAQNWLSTFEQTIAPYVKLSDAERSYYDRMSRTYIERGMDPASFAEDFLTANAIANATGMSRSEVVTYADQLSDYFLGVPAERNMTWGRNIINSWHQGQRQQQMFQLQDEYRQLFAEGRNDDDPLVQRKLAEIQQLQKEIDYNTDATPHNWLVNWISDGVAQVPYMLSGLGAGVVGTGIGAAIGSMIPVVGTKIGATVGNYLGRFVSYKGGFSGSSFYEMKQAGISDATALRLSDAEGIINALNESMLDAVSDTLVGAIGGNAVKTVLYPGIFKKLVTKGSIHNFAGQVALYMAGQGAGEFIQEATQSLTTSAFVYAAEVMDNIPHTKTTMQALSDALEEGVAGFAVGLLFGLPGAVAATAADVRTSTRLFDKAVATPSREAFINSSENVDAVKGMRLAGEHFSDADARSELGKMWDNAAEARLNRLKARAEVAGDNVTTKEGKRYAKRQLSPERLDGRLRSQTTVDYADDSQRTAELKIVYGGTTPTSADSGAPYYGTVRMTVDHAQHTASIDSISIQPGYEAQAQEMVRQAIQDNAPGYEVSWDTDVDMEVSIRDALVRSNPSGTEAGLTYSASNTTGREAEIAEYSSRIRNSFQNLSDAQVNAVVHVLDTLAQHHGMNISELEQQYAGGDFFIHSDPFVAQRARGKRGAYRPLSMEQIAQGVKGVIYAGENADTSTFIHELFHFAADIDETGRKELSRAVKRMARENASTLRQFIDEHQEIFGPRQADDLIRLFSSLDENSDWNTDLNEAMTSLYEAWMANHDDANLTPEVRNVLQKIADFMKQIYSSIKGNAKLDADVQAGFERIMGYDGSSVSSSIQQTRSTKGTLYQSERTTTPESEFEQTEKKLRSIASNFDEHGRHLAPNGKPSNLPYHQWVMVRTSSFKRWFGDWEGAANLEWLMNSEPIAILTGEEFKENLVDSVESFYRTIGNKVTRPGLGEVSLARHDIQSSVAHGVGRLKAIAFAAVPDVIKEGREFNYTENYKERGYDSIVIAAPIAISGETYICEVVLNKETSRNRFYLHEVEIKTKLQFGNQVRPYMNGNHSKRNTRTGASRLIISKLFAEGKFNASKVIDENGEPLLVYHGTASEFTVFERAFLGSSTDANSARIGFFFTDSRKTAEGYGKYASQSEARQLYKRVRELERQGKWDEANQIEIQVEELALNGGSEGVVMPVFLNLRKPYEVDAYGANFKNVDGLFAGFEKERHDGVIVYDLNDNIDDDYTANHYVALESNQIKSIDNTGAFDPDNPDILFQRAYHGSGASFDRFSTDFIGTGEGHQAYGWGIYLTDLEDVARNYAGMAFTEEVKAGRIDFLKNRIDQARKTLSDRTDELNAAQSDSYWENEESYQALLKNDEDAIRSLFFSFARSRYKGMSPTEAANSYRQYQTENLRHGVESAEMTIKAYEKELNETEARPAQKNNLYHVEIPDDAIWLDSEKGAPVSLVKRIAKIPKVRRAIVDNWGGVDDFIKAMGNSSGMGFYNDLAIVLGSDKDASLVLNKAGITGIRYPVGSLSDHPSTTDHNYVIFNADDIKIDNHILFQDDYDRRRFTGNFSRAVNMIKDDFEIVDEQDNEDAYQSYLDSMTAEEGEPFELDESMSASNVSSLRSESEIRAWNDNSWWIDENGEPITNEGEYRTYVDRYVRPLLKGRFANLFHHDEEQSIDEMISAMKPTIAMDGQTDTARDRQFIEALKDEETFRRVFGLLGEVYYLNTTATNAQRVEKRKKINGKMRTTQEVEASPYVDQREREQLQRKLQAIMDNPVVISVMRQALLNEPFSTSSRSTKSRAMKAIEQDVRLYRNLIANILSMDELRPDSLTDDKAIALPSREEMDTMPLSQVKTLLANNRIDAILGSVWNDNSNPEGYSTLADVALLLKSRLTEANDIIEKLKGKDEELSAALDDRDDVFSSVERWLDAVASMLGISNRSASMARKNEINSILFDLNGEKRYQTEATSKGARDKGKAAGARMGTREWLKDMATFYPTLKPSSWSSSRDYEAQLRSNIDAWRQELLAEYKAITPKNVNYLVGQIRQAVQKQNDELSTIRGSLSKLLVEASETLTLAKRSKIDAENQTTSDGFTIGDTESGAETDVEEETIADSEYPVDETTGIPRLTGSEDSKDSQLVEALKDDRTMREVMKRYGAHQQQRIDSSQAYADETEASASRWAEGNITDEDMENFRAEVSASPRLYRRQFASILGRPDMAVRQQGGLPAIDVPETDGNSTGARARRATARQAEGIDEATRQAMINGDETLEGNTERQLKIIGEAIREIRNQIVRDQRKIDNRNEKIASLRSDIADRNRKIRSLENRMRRMDEQDAETIGSLEQELKDLRAVVHNLEIQMASEERHAETERRNLEAKNAKLKERQQEEREYRKLRDYKMKLARSIFRKWTRSVDFRTVAPTMQYIRQTLDPAFRRDWARDPITGTGTIDIDELKELYSGIETGQITDIDKNELKTRLGARLYNRISGEGAKPLNDWTVEELEQLKDRLDEVWTEGRLIQRAKDEAKRNRRRSLRDEILTSVKSNPKYRDEPELTGTTENTKRKRSLKTEMQGNYYATKRMQELTYYIDGGNGQRGTAYDLLVERVRTMLDDEYRNEQRRMKPYEDALKTYRQWLKDNGIKEDADEILFHKQYDVELGDRTVHYNLSALAYIYLSQFNQKARDAVAYGSLISPQEKGHISADDADSRVVDFGGVNQHLIGDDEIEGIGTMRYKAALERATAILNETGAMPIVEAIRDDLWNKDNAQRLFDFSLDVFNQPVVIEDHYLFVHRLDAQGNRPETIKDFNMAAGQALESIEKGFLEEKRTIAPANQMPVNLDLFEGWVESMQQQEHLLAGGRLLSDLRATFETNREVMDVIRRAFGDGMVTELRDYIAHVADPHYSDVRNDVSRVINFLRGSVSTAYLGFKLSSIFVQIPTSLAPFLGSVRTGSMLKSSIQMMAHPVRTWNFITERSVRMERRTPTIMLEDIQKEARKQGKGKLARTWARFNEVGMSGLEWVDKMTVGTGWLAKYYDVLDKNIAEGMDTEVAETVAIKAADDLVYEVQPISDKTEVARLFRSSNALLKMFLQFQQAMNVVYNNVTTDTHQQWAGRKTDKDAIGRIVGRLVGYAGAGIILGLVQQGFDDDDDDLDRLGKLAYWGVSQGVDSIPVVGSIASGLTSAILTGQFDSYTMEENILPFASDFGSYTARLVTALRSDEGPDAQRALSAMEGIALSLGTAIGAPTSTIKQIIRSIEQESFMPMLGRY